MNKFLKTVWDFKVVIIQFITVVAILTILPIACQDKKGTSAMLKEHGYR